MRCRCSTISMRSISRSASTNGACVAAPAHEPGDCRPMRPLKNLCEVAVIGGGLAGLTAAHHAARLGALVTLFEVTGMYGGLVATVDHVDGLEIGRASCRERVCQHV